MPAQIGRFSRVALMRVRADRGSWALCDGLLSGITPQKRTSVRSHRNPVPSWHITNGRAGWRVSAWGRPLAVRLFLPPALDLG
jgi:hypothetical protein